MSVFYYSMRIRTYSIHRTLHIILRIFFVIIGVQITWGVSGKVYYNVDHFKQTQRTRCAMYVQCYVPAID